MKNIQSFCTTPEELLSSPDFLDGVERFLEKNRKYNTSYILHLIAECSQKKEFDEVQKGELLWFLNDPNFVEYGKNFLGKLWAISASIPKKTPDEVRKYADLVEEILSPQGFDHIKGYMVDLLDVAQPKLSPPEVTQKTPLQKPEPNFNIRQRLHGLGFKKWGYRILEIIRNVWGEWYTNFLEKIYAGNSVDVPLRDGKTLLFLVIETGKVEDVLFLIDLWANLNYQDELWRTPLMHASSLDRMSMVNALLKLGGNVNMRDKEGKTAIWHALENRALFSVKFLIQSGVHIDEDDQGGYDLVARSEELGYVGLKDYIETYRGYFISKWSFLGDSIF